MNGRNSHLAGSTGRGPVPPILVQFWHTSPPPDVRALMDTWDTVEGEGLEYGRFDDLSAQKFIEENFDARVCRAYLSCAVPAMKADLFRLCALLVRPGIYVDADTRRTGKRGRWRPSQRSAVSSLAELFQRLQRGLLFRRGNRITNSFMIVRQRNDALLRTVLERAIANVEQRIANRVWLVTGPGVITNLRNEVGEDHELFRGFEFWTEEQLAPYMGPGGPLSYKKTEDHWVLAQKARSIFVPPSSCR